MRLVIIKRLTDADHAIRNSPLRYWRAVTISLIWMLSEYRLFSSLFNFICWSFFIKMFYVGRSVVFILYKVNHTSWATTSLPFNWYIPMVLAGKTHMDSPTERGKWVAFLMFVCCLTSVVMKFDLYQLQNTFWNWWFCANLFDLSMIIT